MKTCHKCKKVKTEDSFYRGRRECKDCIRERIRSDYNKDPKNHANNSKRRRNARKIECIAYKGGVCEDCGGTFHPAAFDFHHKNEAEKEFDIGSKLSGSMVVLRPELDKCLLLCSNCHRVRHFVEW